MEKNSKTRKSPTKAISHLLEKGSNSPPDLETGLPDDAKLTLRSWLRMLSCTGLIENELRSRLRIKFDITLPRFDLMAQLERYPDGLKMGEISKRMMVTSGNITGITDQLERENLAIRITDPADRRSYAVKLTSAGRKSFAKMAKAHEAWLDELMRGLNASEKNQLIALLTKLKSPLSKK